MEISVLEIALQRINEGDDISNTLLISVRDAVLELFCHEQLNCNEAENEIFKIDLISLDQKSRKDYIINLSSFLIEKKDLETPGYFNYFYNKFKSTLSMINENKGTVAIGIAVIVLGALMVNQHYKLNELTETVSFQNKSIERQKEENAILQKKILDKNDFDDKLQNDEIKKLSTELNNLSNQIENNTGNLVEKRELLESIESLRTELNSKNLENIKSLRTELNSKNFENIKSLRTELNSKNFENIKSLKTELNSKNLENAELKDLSKTVNDLNEKYKQIEKNTGNLVEKQELLKNIINLRKELNSKNLSEDDIKKIIQDVKDKRTFYELLSENALSLTTTLLQAGLTFKLL